MPSVDIFLYIPTREEWEAKLKSVKIDCGKEGTAIGDLMTAVRDQGQASNLAEAYRLAATLPKRLQDYSVKHKTQKLARIIDEATNFVEMCENVVKQANQFDSALAAANDVAVCDRISFRFDDET